MEQQTFEKFIKLQNTRYIIYRNHFGLTLKPDSSFTCILTTPGNIAIFYNVVPWSGTNVTERFRESRTTKHVSAVVVVV